MPNSTEKITRTITVTKEEFSAVEDYLLTYSFYKKLLKIDKYEQEFFSDRSTQPDLLDRSSEIAIAHAKMFEVRHFIMNMQNCDEKLFLYHHYVHCNSVERCAELIGISRSSAFRLKKRALVLAAEYYAKKKKS